MVVLSSIFLISNNKFTVFLEMVLDIFNYLKKIESIRFITEKNTKDKMNFPKILFLLLGNYQCELVVNLKNISQNMDFYDDIYNDDDDGFELHKNSSIIPLYLNVELFRDENCTEYTGFRDSIEFNFPESCSCLNNNVECWHNFLHSIYFTNFNWTANFKILYPEFPVNGNLNISKCIIEFQNKNISCIPCQGLYFKYQRF